MHRSVGIIALVSATSIISSCSTSGGGPFGFMMFDPNHHVPAAEPLFSRGEDSCIDASYLFSVLSRDLSPEGEKQNCRLLRYRMQRALPFGNIYDDKDNVISDYSRRERNEAIDTLIFASNKRCGDYVHFLQTYQGNVRVTSGLASQATAILATLTTGSTAQWLAAGSAFSTGAGNTTYEVHFANRTVAMLTKAFDTARLERLRSIEDKKQCTPEQYSFSKAMADIFDYHTSCSITTGLMQAQEAVEQQRSPNLETLAKLAEQIAAARTSFAKVDPPTAQKQTATPTPAPGPAPSSGPPAQSGQSAPSQTTRSPSSADTNAAGANAAGPTSTTAGTGTGAGSNQAVVRPPTCPFNSTLHQPQQLKS